MVLPLPAEEDMLKNHIPFALAEYFASLPQFSSVDIGQCGVAGFTNISGEGETFVPVLAYWPIGHLLR